MAERTYLVVVTAGVHSWTVTDTDAPGYGLMDPLTIGWSMPDTDHRPQQPDPMVATFSVVTPTSELLDDLLLGSPVSIAVTFGPVAKDTPDVTFYGRIAQGQASPHPRGLLYKFTCADLTTDLNGYDIGVAALAAEPVATRMTNYLTRAGLADTTVIRDPVVAAIDPNLTVELVDKPSATNLLAAILELWGQVALPGLAELAANAYLPIIAPYPPAQPQGAGRWALDVIPEAYIPSAVAPLPAVFGHWWPDPQGWGLRMDPDDRAAGVIDACVVEFDASWTAIQPAVVDRAAVTWLMAAVFTDPDTNPRVQQVTYTTNPPPAGVPPTLATRETQMIGLITPPNSPSSLAALGNAQRMGNLMVPVPQNPSGWGPDSFRWLLWKDPAGLAAFPVIFPRHDATGAPTPRVVRTAAYVRPIVVVDVPPKWNAADFTRDWVGGQLAAVQLTIESGRPVIDFQLVPTLPEPGNPDTSGNSWNVATGTWDAQSGVWDDLSPARPAFRWSDPALAGRVWDDLHPQPWNLYRLARGSN